MYQLVAEHLFEYFVKGTMIDVEWKEVDAVGF